jgi:CRISPR-associated protein Csm4
MRTLKLTIEPVSDFGTPIVGDTLFGHLCWALRFRSGEAALKQALQGYCSGQPFAVLSDAFPAGWLPRPTVPLSRLGLLANPASRKADKERVWLPAGGSGAALVRWLESAGTAKVAGASGLTGLVTQNTINRLTGTTGKGPFAPRQVERIEHRRAARLECYVVLDEERLPLQDFLQALTDIGRTGYGRDASTGLGKFDVLQHETWNWPAPSNARHAMALSACAPNTSVLVSEDCHYQPLTRFGRHGSLHGHAGRPFKRPLLLLRTGAVLALSSPVTGCAFHGCGLGGVGASISDVEPATVHQGYAPIVPIELPPTDTFGRHAA